MPLGIKSHRAVKSRGVAVGMIVVAAYYLMRGGGHALVETGQLEPLIGVWTPNVIFAILGVYLFIMAQKELSLWQTITLRLWKGNQKMTRKLI